MPAIPERARDTDPVHDVAIIGAGFSGIGTAIALKRAGFEDFTIIEGGDGVGGAWYWNRYPGVAVDIPSASYQFSYAQRPDWSRVYAPGDELKRYAEDLVDEFDLHDHLRFNTLVDRAEWSDEHHSWTLGTNSGESVEARYVIGATGVFNEPSTPDIPGLDTFAGPTMHTARWDDDIDLFARRVAVIGTGASAVQVIPSIAGEVAELTVFQRTPIWCLPRFDAPIPGIAKAVLRHLPGAQQIARAVSQAYVEVTFPLAAHYASILPMAKFGERVGRDFLRREVKDPETRAKLTPDYSVGCKRPSFSNEYLSTFNRDNVALVTESITEVTPDGVRTADGVEHELDVLILATGFTAFERGSIPPYPVFGADGRDLQKHWIDTRLQAYEGVSIPGYPNFFAILGPYGYNGASYFTLIENQARHIVRLLKRARSEGATRVEVTPAANDRYFAHVLGRRHRQVFFQGSCETANSYYFDENGDVPLRPSLTLEAAWRSARFPLSDYRFAR